MPVLSRFRSAPRRSRVGGTETLRLQAQTLASACRRRSFLRRLSAWLTGFLKENGHAVSAVQSGADHESESTGPTEQPAQAQSASPARTVEPARNEKEKARKPKPEVNPRNLNRHVRKFVDQTIIGRVTIEMVLAELERRGYPYRPPIREDGTLVIRECDLTRAFLDRLPVSTVDRERIAHRNAELLLRL